MQGRLPSDSVYVNATLYSAAAKLKQTLLFGQSGLPNLPGGHFVNAVGDGSRVFMSFWAAQRVGVFSWQQGTLKLEQEISGQLPSPAGVLLHPNGKWLYVGNSYHQQISLFSE